MCTQGEVRAIVADMRARLEGLFPQQQIDAILFGSYARGDAEDGSDIDVMFLVDAPRQDIARQHWRIGEAAAEILLERGVFVSRWWRNAPTTSATPTFSPSSAMLDGREFLSWVDDTRQLVSGAEAFWQSVSAFLQQKYTDA